LAFHRPTGHPQAGEAGMIVTTVTLDRLVSALLGRTCHVYA
jgi:hypothetical protein